MRLLVLSVLTVGIVGSAAAAQQEHPCIEGGCLPAGPGCTLDGCMFMGDDSGACFYECGDQYCGYSPGEGEVICVDT